MEILRVVESRDVVGINLEALLVHAAKPFSNQKSVLKPGRNYKHLLWNCVNFRYEKGTQTQLFGPDIFRLRRGLPREGVGAKKFGMSLETREIKFFGRDIPGFCRDIPAVPQKLEKKTVCVQVWAPRVVCEKLRHQQHPAPKAATEQITTRAMKQMARIARCHCEMRCDSNRTPPKR